MSEIPKPEIVPAGNWQEEKQRPPYYESHAKNPYQERAFVSSVKNHSEGDIASILGISPEAVNAEIKDAIGLLLDQLTFLREQSQQAISRINFLEKQVDSHTYIPIFNRRAFLREFTRRVEHAQKVSLSCSVVLICWLDYDKFRKELGLNESINILTTIVKMILKHIRASDVTGMVGPATIGIAMPLAGEEEARKRALHVVKMISEEKVMIKNESFSINIAVGVHESSKNETAEEAVDLADLDLILSI